MKKILENLKKELLENFSEIISIVHYGSTCSQNAERFRNINVCVVFSEISPEIFEKLKKVVQKYVKKKVIFLILTLKHIKTSLDSFPLEFLDIKERHELIFGEDIFDSLSFDRENLRLEIERQIKSLKVRLYQILLEEKSPRKIAFVLKQTLKSVIFCMKGFLYSYRGKSLFNSSDMDVLDEFSKEGMDLTIFKDFLQKKKIDFFHFLKKIEEIGDFFDQL